MKQIMQKLKKKTKYFINKGLYIFFQTEYVLQVMMIVYQPIFYVLELKFDKNAEYIISQKSKRIYNSKIIALHGAFLPNLKYFRHKIGIQYSSSLLFIEKNNYATKVVNVNRKMSNIIVKSSFMIQIINQNIPSEILH